MLDEDGRVGKGDLSGMKKRPKKSRSANGAERAREDVSSSSVSSASFCSTHKVGEFGSTSCSILLGDLPSPVPPSNSSHPPSGQSDCFEEEVESKSRRKAMRGEDGA